MGRDILGDMINSKLDTWHRDYLIPFTQNLYRQGKMTKQEFLSVMSMIRSTDQENTTVAVELLRLMCKRKGDRE